VVTQEKNSPTAAHAGRKIVTKTGTRCLGVWLGHTALLVINMVGWPFRVRVGRQTDNLLP
jgi:O-antigen ligase